MRTTPALSTTGDAPVEQIRTGRFHGLDLACCGWFAGSRVGGGAQVFQWIDPVLACGGDVCVHGRELFLLALAMKRLPLGTAYVVWTGIGAVGTAILGMALFGEPASPGRIACIGLIVAGIVGLKVC